MELGSDVGGGLHEERRGRLRSVSGPALLLTLIFNSGNAEERIEELNDKELVVTRTHGLIDFSGREAFVEFNMRGAKVSDIQG